MGGGKKKKPGRPPGAAAAAAAHPPWPPPDHVRVRPDPPRVRRVRRPGGCRGTGLAVRFLGGFPPRELSAEDEGRDDLDGLGVGPNESLIVRFVPLDGGAANEAAASKKKAAGDEEKPPAPGGPDEVDAKPAAAARPRRAAAEEASRNFASVIAAQDAMMAGSPSPKSKKRAGGKTAGGGKKSANNKGGKRAKITGTGYRLRDGAASASPAKPRAAARRRPAAGKGEAAFSSRDDVASGLLSSLNGGGGNVGRFLRAAMCGAVERTYEAARARARVAAVASGGYSFEAVGSGGRAGGGHVLGGAAGAGEGGHQTVSYSRGIDGRGTNEDDVEIIPADATKAALEMVYRTPPDGSEEEDGREMLRPASVAQMSPRLFWSVVYHSRGAGSVGNEGSAPPSFEEMLVALLPELDWTFLGRGGRRRALSEKARENLAQERAAENGGDDGDDGEGADEESARRAIERLEDDIVRSAASANDGEGVPAAADERERRAQAALARFGGASSAGVATEENGGSDAEWHVVTPDDDDIDELLECIRAVDAPSVQDNASAWADALLPSVPNWRRLADLAPAEVLSILTGAGWLGRDLPDEGTAARWIDEAQARTLEEVMSEILDGDGPALDRLCGEDVRSGNPRDLARWGACPSLLAGAVNAPVPGGGSGDGDGEEDAPRWTEEDAGRWTSRARTALADLPWLAEFGHG
ncbi:hypothetical protein THAOC_26103 [Thalassiosira oceanica]|uniref:Uncharacterized protein n=1 Tax=Thalassiosira oceanica TaxID=159749 RepID=K0RKN6_THAOC|nr:hypothetical protein THAOC_26103 [Thalassiosira oceanica]|eukprot:EJK54288.1 hypothetical protein THAOC_26103 [Thalassiosira oceanica]